MPTPAELLAAAKPAKVLSNGHAKRAARQHPLVCKVREIRKQLRLSQTDVAKAIGMSTLAIWDAEHGSDMRLTTAAKLADFFGRTIADLWPELHSKPSKNGRA